MNKVKVIIISHHHIPYGSSDDEFEHYYAKSLKPLVTSLYKTPSLVLVMHCSGVLLEWIEKHHPELFMLLEELINRKQIELLGGGYYEPVFPLISMTDKIGQIELLTTYIRKHFGKRPRGCWLPGLFWEQNYASMLTTCGIDYAFVEDTSFFPDEVEPISSHIFLTEDQGKLSTLIPVRSITSKEEAITHLAKGKEFLKHHPAEDHVISLHIDKNSSNEEVAAHFETLFAYIVKESDFYELTLPLKLLKQNILPIKTYITGKNLRKSLVIHPEANDIYGKMTYVHTLVNQLRGDKARKKNAREELWKAQGIDVFYLDPEKGIQNNKLRKTTYRSLIEAEKITREKGVFIPSILTFDVNFDGKEEYVIQGSDINCYISQLGASIFELDYLPAAYNYIDTYHLQEDRCIKPCKRTSFVEYLSPAGSSLHEILSDSQHRNRFLGSEWFYEESVNRSQNTVSFRIDGVKTEPFGAIGLSKQYALKKNTLTVIYTLLNNGKETERFTFLPQIELSFMDFSTKAYQLYVNRGGNKQELDLDILDLRNIDCIIYKDCKNDVSITLKSVMPFDAWQYPVFSPQSVYQSTCVLPIIEVLLTPGEHWETSFQLSFEKA